jgi:hypothetical protein
MLLLDDQQWILSGAQVQTLDLPPVRFYLDKLVPEEGVVLLHGKYGSYKTPLTLHMAKAMAAGTPLWGFNTARCRVLYIEGDSPKNAILPRMQSLDVNVPGLDIAFVYPGLDVVNPLTPEWNKQRVSALATAHAKEPYDVVIVDSLRASHQMPDKDSETPPRVYSSIVKLFPGAVNVVIHHDRKTRAPEKYAKVIEEQIEDESFSGSQAWINHATTALHVVKHGRTNKEWVTLHQTKSQASREIDDIDLKVDHDGISITQAVSMTADQMKHAFAILKWRSWVDLDRQLAQHFGVSTEWAKKHRIEYEKNVGPIPRTQG